MPCFSEIGYLVLFTYFCVEFFSIITCASTFNRDGKVICNEIPSEVLEEVLGAAFNARYMSIDQPAEEANQNGKRTTREGADFYVDSDFKEDIEDGPAWSLMNHAARVRDIRDTRWKRSSEYEQEWHCRSRIKWTDLGRDYFPRYLRSVECLSHDCWFNLYKCKPRSFTIKILKRMRNKCATAGPGTKIGNVGLPRDLKEMWVWEERAVNFCCDCTI
ncbi:unnamed protein product [Phyllotreta striolata]|uniref:Protein trunk n=1 Tax=Phyllotreta striolata TaxID=444603 RepID=A0A9N9TVZ8_PHYSR|nr:unnamed protein product [Phyllotreta striolata]